MAHSFDIFIDHLLCADVALEEKREEPRSYLGKEDAGREKSQCRDPEIRLCLVCLSQRKEARVAG